MDVARILAELRAERAQLEEAILSLERLARGRGKRRGRPPAWLEPEDNNGAPPAPDAPRRRGRPPGSKNKNPAARAAETSAADAASIAVA